MSDIERESFEHIRRIAWDAVGTDIETEDKALVKIHEFAKEQAARQALANGEVEPVVWINPEDAKRTMIACPGERADVSPCREGRFSMPLYTNTPAKVPEGWKLVPIESTSDMDIAGMDSLHSSYEGYIIDRDAAEVIWNAMVGAAPAPPQEQ